jgi:hypothetical protein
MPTPAGDKPPVVGIGIFVWEDMELCEPINYK